MKICFLNTFYSPDIGGGAEVILKGQVEGLKRAGHEVFVIALSNDGRSRSDIIDDVDVVRVPLFNIYFSLGKNIKSIMHKLIWHIIDRYNWVMGRRLHRELIKNRPDVVVTHNLAGWSISVWKQLHAAGIPVVHVLHDQYLLCSRSTRYRNGTRCIGTCADCKILRSNHRHASQQVQKVVGVSEFVLKRHVEEFGYFKNVGHCVIRNARYVSVSAADVGNHGGRVRFGYIGGVAEYKGVGLLVDAFLQYASDTSTLDIAGAGTSSYVAQLKIRIGKNKRIRFLGFETPEKFFANIDILVVPSLWEDTLPGVVFEGLLFGKSVIGSARGGIPEMLRDAPAGILFEPSQDGALGQALVEAEVTIDARRGLAKAIATYARPYADEGAWIKRWEAILEETVAESENMDAATI